jgi:hypothetical protein
VCEGFAANGVFEYRVLREIFGAERDGNRGMEELNDLYCLPYIFRVIKPRGMRWVGHVVRMGERRGIYRVLVGKPEGKRPLGGPRHR